MTTGVTCPTVRIHPAVIAQAAATCGVLHEGGFTLGVGSGEALNEHILGDRWPEAYERAGVDELYVQQVGPDQSLFFDRWAPAVLGRFHA